MSQLPPNESQLGMLPSSKQKQTQNHSFWLTGIGGYVLGALTVIIVLLLARLAGDRDEPGSETRPTNPSVQNNPPQNNSPANNPPQNNTP